MKTKAKITSILLCLAMVVSCLMPAMNANASNPSVPLKYKKNGTYIAVKYKDESFNYYYVKLGSKIKNITGLSAKSSKKSVVKAEKVIDANHNGTVYLTLKKKGTSKITIKVKKNGKTKTYKFKIKVVNYKNPFSSMKVGSKNIKSKFKKDNFVEYKVTATSNKIKVKAAKGWKIKGKMSYTYADATGAVKTKKIKNGAKITTLKGDYGVVYVKMYNSKTRVIEEMMLALNNM